MKQMWLIGAVASVMLAGSPAAQTPPPKPTPQTQPDKKAPPAQPTAKPAEKPMQPADAPPKQGTTTRSGAQSSGEVPTGEVVLGTVTIPSAVRADGKPLARGRYTVRLTAQNAQPTVPGQKPDLNRWVEFVQGGQVKGREVVSIVPADEVNQTMPGPDLDPAKAPRTATKVEMLKGGEYLRVWISRQGVQYLIHLPPAAA
jgi:hypothetical protein